MQHVHVICDAVQARVVQSCNRAIGREDEPGRHARHEVQEEKRQVLLKRTRTVSSFVEFSSFPRHTWASLNALQLLVRRTREVQHSKGGTGRNT